MAGRIDRRTGVVSAAGFGRGRAVCAALAVGTLLVSGNAAATWPPIFDDPTLATARFTPAKLVWTACDEGKARYDCATLSVPLNWSAQGRTPGRWPYASVPASKQARITLALRRRPADDQAHKLGSLLMNPGGPGSSGTEAVAEVGSRYGASVLNAYDIVGWDPRGVAKSSAITCVPLTDKEFAASLDYIPDLRKNEDYRASVLAARKFTAGCIANTRTAGLIGHVDAVSTVMDMETLRKALGEERLHYIGESYGTLYGALYADIFPRRVGRMVLDSAVDPTANSVQFYQAQLVSQENALRKYITEGCTQAQGCPLTGTTEQRVQQILDFLASLEKTPLKTSNPARTVSASYAAGLIGLGVSHPAMGGWNFLTAALAPAIRNGDGTVFLMIGDSAYENDDDGALRSMFCLDYAVLKGQAVIQGVVAESVRSSPIFGRYNGDFGPELIVKCNAWPQGPVRIPVRVRARGSNPVVVIGSTGDAVVPYLFARSVAAQLENAVLVTNNQVIHVAYTRNNACLANAVDAYLVDGIVPKKGIVCN